MNSENKHLRFVLKYYAPGLFDTRRALERYKSSHRPSIGRLLRRVTAVAAALALCLTIAYFLSAPDSQTTELYAEGQTTVHTLPDGSLIKLYPHSSLRYSAKGFDGNERQVEMNGKVEFTVTKNPDAPFTVTAGAYTVRVLGTVFTVNEQAGNSTTEVSVSSGKVLFYKGSEADGIVLTKGMTGRVTSDGSKPEIVTDGTPRTFVYDNTPLAQVLNDLSAHFEVSLDCADAEGKALTAEFSSADSIDEIIFLIEKTLDVKIKTSAKVNK